MNDKKTATDTFPDEPLKATKEKPRHYFYLNKLVKRPSCPHERLQQVLEVRVITSQLGLIRSTSSNHLCALLVDTLKHETMKDDETNEERVDGDESFDARVVTWCGGGREDETDDGSSGVSDELGESTGGGTTVVTGVVVCEGGVKESATAAIRWERRAGVLLVHVMLSPVGPYKAMEIQKTPK